MLNNSELLYIKKTIENMTSIQHIEIAKLLKNNGIHLTENNNGIFINLNNLSTIVIDELLNYIKFIEKQNNLLKNQENIKTQLENNFFNNIKE